jgi:4-diphosphocytidyl-2-C-methyl-D-erythritol kinase
MTPHRPPTQSTKSQAPTAADRAGCAARELAPAKINLTLRVVGRRNDGYHDIESLVAFAGLADDLSLTPGSNLELVVRGPTAASVGAIADNLVLKAAHALADRVTGLTVGSFVLSKRLPVAAGLGGGSSDAAAALRLLARVNRLASDDERLMQAAQATGADVPVCLDPRPRVMGGIGDILSSPLEVPPVPTVLANPGVMVATKDVFKSLRLRSTSISVGSPVVPRAKAVSDFIGALASFSNDLEAPAIELAPVIADVLAALRSSPGCGLARMSGSGATCFGLFERARSAAVAAAKLRAEHPSWWVRATALAA